MDEKKFLPLRLFFSPLQSSYFQMLLKNYCDGGLIKHLQSASYIVSRCF